MCRDKDGCFIATYVTCFTRSLANNSLDVFNADEFEGLHALSSVDLSYNQLFHLGALPNISSLVSLDLSYNQLKTLGHNFTENIRWAHTLTNLYVHPPNRRKYYNIYVMCA